MNGEPIMSHTPNQSRQAAQPSTPPALASLPNTGFLRQTQVLSFVPISKTTLWRRVQLCTFPRPVKLSSRVTAWRAEDLRRWIEEQGVPT
jgi:prophage regulatory protein